VHRLRRSIIGQVWNLWFVSNTCEESMEKRLSVALCARDVHECALVQENRITRFAGCSGLCWSVCSARH
jgi:hypothetical protein